MVFKKKMSGRNPIWKTRNFSSLIIPPGKGSREKIQINIEEEDSEKDLLTVDDIYEATNEFLAWHKKQVTG